MSRVELLTDSRNSLSVKFLEFTRIVSKHKGRVAIFFEGEDEKYYSARINSIRPDIEWTGVNCGGKSNVLKMREKVRSHMTYQSSACLFFVDSDFDKNKGEISHSDTYITPCYSIENLYFSERVLTRVLSAEFGLSDACENADCYKNAISFFNKTKTEYLEAIEQFNYIIRELRLMEKSGNLKTKLNLNNINFDSLVKIEIKSSQKIYNEKNVSEIFPEVPPGLYIDTEISKSHFSGLNPELWFRGKQHLEFMRLYISRLKEDRCKKESRVLFKEKGNVKLNLTKSNCISELSQYAETPRCLKDFLEEQSFNKIAA